jgi:ComF family protein
MTPITRSIVSWFDRARPLARAAVFHCTAALDALYPRECVACGGERPATSKLCRACAATFIAIGGSGCRRCGAPRIGQRKRRRMPRDCARCHRRRFAFRGAVAGLRYGAAVRATIHAIQFRHRTEAIATLVPFVVRAVEERGFARRIDAVVPVPLHVIRKFHRGFDQAELLARGVARELGKPLIGRAIRRRLFAPARSLSRGDQRSFSLGDAFGRGWRAGAVRGGRILLVDDVFTTGATADAAARALLAAGARSVCVAVAAT